MILRTRMIMAYDKYINYAGFNFRHITNTIITITLTVHWYTSYHDYHKLSSYPGAGISLEEEDKKPGNHPWLHTMS